MGQRQYVAAMRQAIQRVHDAEIALRYTNSELANAEYMSAREFMLALIKDARAVGNGPEEVVPPQPWWRRLFTSLWPRNGWTSILRWRTGKQRNGRADNGG